MDSRTGFRTTVVQQEMAKWTACKGAIASNLSGKILGTLLKYYSSCPRFRPRSENEIPTSLLTVRVLLGVLIISVISL